MGRGRGRGKGKKLTIVPTHEDPGNDEEELLPAHKRRGQQQKTVKEEVDKEEADEVEENDEDDSKDAILNKEVKGPILAVERGKKRKRNLQVKEKGDSLQEENGVGARSSNSELDKSNGFRQNGSRRKSKPRRAAEAGIECKFI